MQMSWSAPSSITACQRTSTMCGWRARASSRGSAVDPARDLHDHEPVVEVGLLGEEDPGERPPAQLADQPVGPDLVADLGQGSVGLGLGPARQP